MDLTGRSAGAVAGKFAYGALFVLAWPALLAVWAQRLDRLGAVPWPAPSALVWAAGLATGLALMAAAMHALWRHGGGLPMNAFPPDRLVERSVFGVFNHPIYVGFCLAAFSLASLAGSPAGFWLVAPVASCAAAALVCGYEGPALAARSWDCLSPMKPALQLGGGRRL
jgi:protein-S-isoprenylcysteine O-methyltransferase Ste14